MRFDVSETHAQKLMAQQLMLEAYGLEVAQQLMASVHFTSCETFNGTFHGFAMPHETINGTFHGFVTPCETFNDTFHGFATPCVTLNGFAAHCETFNYFVTFACETFKGFATPCEMLNGLHTQR